MPATASKSAVAANATSRVRLNCRADNEEEKTCAKVPKRAGTSGSILRTISLKAETTEEGGRAVLNTTANRSLTGAADDNLHRPWDLEELPGCCCERLRPHQR